MPEEPFDVDEVCRLVSARFDRGDTHVIGVVAEGATPLPGTMPLRDGGVDEYGHRRFTGVAQQLGEELERRTGKEVRTTVLGHVQRGGTPTSFDRVLATRFGLHATVAAHEGAHGQMVALRGTEIELVPLEKAVATLKTVTAVPAGRDRRLHRLIADRRRRRRESARPGSRVAGCHDPVVSGCAAGQRTTATEDHAVSETQDWRGRRWDGHAPADLRHRDAPVPGARASSR